MAPDPEFLATLRIEPAPDGYTCPDFDCGEEEISGYICDGTSANDQLAGVSRSYLVLQEEKLVGYFTLLADNIRLETKERPKEIVNPNAPALKLGRLGVDKRFRKRGAGDWILDNVVGLALDLSDSIGLRYVTVDALQRPSLIKWYTDYGFKRNKAMRKKWRVLLKLADGEEAHFVSMRLDLRL